MDHIFLYLLGAIASGVSGYITWLSWRDTRASYKFIAKLEARVYTLETEIEQLKQKPDQPLNS